MGSSIKVEANKNMIKYERPYILMIKETKMVEQGVMDLSRLHWKNYHRKSISSRGASRGITTPYNSKKFAMKLVKETNNLLLTEL